MPTAFWPIDAPTVKILELAAVAWMRAVDECDEANVDCVGIIIWQADAWWRVIVLWLCHYAQYGDRDPVSAARLDLSGRRHHPGRPTFVAHKNHKQRLFEGAEAMTLQTFSFQDLDEFLACNASVQTWVTNKLLRSHHIATLATTFSSSRFAIATIMRD